MRYAAPLAIAATALAAALTIVAVRTVGVGAEAHPVTLHAAAHIGWVGYLALSIAAVAVGLRFLSRLPFAQWGIRTVALAKVIDATRDAWLVFHHPALGSSAVGEVLPAILVIAATAIVALRIVSPPAAPGRRLDPEFAL